MDRRVIRTVRSHVYVLDVEAMTDTVALVRKYTTYNDLNSSVPRLGPRWALLSQSLVGHFAVSPQALGLIHLESRTLKHPGGSGRAV